MGQEAPFGWPVRLRFRRIRDFSDSFRETVRKRVLRQWLDKVQSLRRAYITDLSDVEWAYLDDLAILDQVRVGAVLHPDVGVLIGPL